DGQQPQGQQAEILPRHGMIPQGMPGRVLGPGEWVVSMSTSLPPPLRGRVGVGGGSHAGFALHPGPPPQGGEGERPPDHLSLPVLSFSVLSLSVVSVVFFFLCSSSLIETVVSLRARSTSSLIVSPGRYSSIISLNAWMLLIGRPS